MTIETHPLSPFLPPAATVLFLGSFPPPQSRWSMHFFYPNWINDFWRIQGLLHYQDKHWFEVPGTKTFDQVRIEAFCTQRGYAFYDTAQTVRRLKDNASDNYLEILTPVDLSHLLTQLPRCQQIVTTGGKASQELQHILEQHTGTPLPLIEIGTCLKLTAYGRELEWWRMPSTSRAYPLKLEKKAEFYKMVGGVERI